VGGIELSQLSSDSLQGVIHSFGMRRKKRGYFRIGVAGQKQPEHLALVIGKLGLHPAVQFSAEFSGLPPLLMKPATQDPAMLDRAEAMLRDMGAAAYFIIDRTEEFQFAKGADTNGDVYNNLIALCKEAVSVLVNGAVIGQDTVNGNRSKEESSIRLFEKLVMADRKMLAGYWNSTVIPALVYIGILPEGSVFSWQQEEDVEKLWAMVVQLLQFKDVPNDWIEEKFGIVCTDKAFTVPGQLSVPQPREVDFFATAP